jgi:hypothetical protein
MIKSGDAYLLFDPNHFQEDLNEMFADRPGGVVPNIADLTIQVGDHLEWKDPRTGAAFPYQLGYFDSEFCDHFKQLFFSGIRVKRTSFDWDYFHQFFTNAISSMPTP